MSPRCRRASRARRSCAAVAGDAAERLPREDGDVVSVGRERAGEGGAEEARTAGDDDAHALKHRPTRGRAAAA